jgi:hypothetical protein
VTDEEADGAGEGTATLRALQPMHVATRREGTWSLTLPERAPAAAHIVDSAGPATSGGRHQRSST